MCKATLGLQQSLWRNTKSTTYTVYSDLPGVIGGGGGASVLQEEKKNK